MRRKHALGKYSGLYIGMFPAKIIRNQPELFEGRFEVVDDFLGRLGQLHLSGIWLGWLYGGFVRSSAILRKSKYVNCST